jgi:peptide alpha-N-acetyltransferase
MASGGGAAELPSKEASCFKNVVKFYEDKQYKKGLKEADKILRQVKFKEHGETLAMKGLILNCMDRKEEAYDFAKRGLRGNMRSHVCWHVYGLIHRSDRDYDQAIRSYLQALRIDTENIQILRDLSLLQIQRRELAGFMETRRKLLELKSNQKNNWIGLSLSHHLLKNYDEAERVLSVYQETDKTESTGPQDDYEKSEMLLYKNMIIHESGNLEKALSHLDEIASECVDELALNQTRASLLVTLGRFEEAETRYMELLDTNVDNYEYHAGLQCARTKQTEKPTQWNAVQLIQLAALYETLNGKFGPKAYGVQRMELNFLSGDAFATKLSGYVKRYLRRGIPSLFTDLKALYDDEAKVAIIETVFEGMLASLKASATFPDSDDWESPTVMVWTLNFLCQHNSKLRRIPKALEFIDQALEHTPTVVELYLAKARAQKRGGNLKAASETADYARCLDLQDRYLNSKCALYQLRADNSSEAEKCMSLFTKVRCVA